MGILRVSLSSLVALLFLAPSQAQNGGSIYNVVTVELMSNGRIVGKPQFIMELGSTVVAQYATPDGYSMKVILDGAGSQTTKERNVDVELYLPDRDRWVLSGHPVVRTKLKQPSAVTFTSRSGKVIEMKIIVDDDFRSVADRSYGKKKRDAEKLAFWRMSLDKPVSRSFKKAAM